MHVQRIRQGVDVDQCDVPFPALHSADVGAVKAGKVGQLLLR